MALYAIYALVKFFDFFYTSYPRRIAKIKSAYENAGRTIQVFDAVMIVFMAVLLALLYISGVEYLSFVTGLLVGMTLIQIYFHRFSKLLSPEHEPEAPVSAIKVMSYAIQANLGLAWRELIFVAVLLVWGLYMLAAQGFGRQFRAGLASQPNGAQLSAIAATANDAAPLPASRNGKPAPDKSSPGCC